MSDAPQIDWDLVEDLVFQCLELRAAKAGGDAAIAALLAVHSDALVAQVRRILGDVSSWGQSSPADGPELRIPDRLGPYTVGARLGQGGMGAVYEARDEALGQKVAIKVVRPDLLVLGSARERFRREIEAVARLSHPGIVPVYQVGEDGGVPWFAMELVRGGSLAELLQRLRGRDPATLRAEHARAAFGSGDGAGSASDSGAFEGRWERLCLRWARQLADALAHAHGRSVLHRDVKPSNVVIDAAGHARLCDFGLAHADDGHELTRSGAVLGSLPYVPPEQLSGEQVEHDARGDVYSLGVTLYEMLALRSPFLADREASTRRNVETAACAPLRQLNPAVSRDCAAVVAVAMEKDPQRRYQSMAELAADLQRVLEHRPIVARPPGAVLRLWRSSQRHPVAATMVVASVVIVLATVATYTFGLREQRDRALAAQLEAQRLREIDRVRSYRAGVQAAQLALRSGQVGPARQQLDACPEELRGWEWHHLRRQTDESVHVAKVSEAFLRRAVVTAGGVFVGGIDGVLRRVRRGADGAPDEIVELGREEGLMALDASADGRLVLSGHRDHRLRTWDGAGGRLLGECDFADLYGDRVLQAQQQNCLGVAVDAGRVRGYAASAGGAVRVIDLATGAAIGGFCVPEVRRGLFSIAISPDGELLAIARDHEIVLATPRGEVVRVLRGHQGFVFSLEFSVDGAQLLSACQDRTVRLWRVLDGEPGMICVGHDGEVHQATFGPDGTIWSAGNDATLRQFDATTGRERQRRLGHAAAAYSVSLAQRGELIELLTAGWDGTLRWWDASAGAARRRVGGPGRTLRQPLQAHSEGTLVSMADDQHGVRTFAVPSGDRVAPLVEGSVTALAVRGERLAFVRDDQLHVRGRAEPLALGDAGLRRLCWLDDGTLVGSESGGHLVSWSPDGVAARREAAHDGEVHALVAVEGGLVSAGWDGRVLRWRDGVAEELLRTDAPWDDAVSSPDRGTIYVSGLRRVVSIGLGSGEVLWQRSMAVRVQSVAIDSSGRRLLLAGTDRALHVLDTADGEELLGLPADNLLQSVAVVGADDVVVTASVYSEVDLWLGR